MKRGKDDRKAKTLVEVVMCRKTKFKSLSIVEGRIMASVTRNGKVELVEYRAQRGCERRSNPVEKTTKEEATKKKKKKKAKTTQRGLKGRSNQWKEMKKTKKGNHKKR
jgi:hypothetical protein